MDSKIAKIRRTFAAQLTIKHKLQVLIPSYNSADSILEIFINEMYGQLCNKLSKQNDQLLSETNKESPLFVQRKQLQKDIEDFNVLNHHQDAHAIQSLVERIEHMALLNKKYDVGGILLNPPMHIPSQSVTPITLNPDSTSCSYRVLCSELIERLNWPTEIFAPKYDRCFCKTCYPLTIPSICQGRVENNFPIIIPRNWVKFGLKVDETQAEIHRIWDKWVISYHGTVPSAALSMIKHRQICLPGDTLFDGTQLLIRPGHILGQRAFFTSPTIRYAAQSHYATPIEFTSQIDKRTYTAKIVLRCRQMPDSFTIQGETLNNTLTSGTDFCDVVPDEQIEWKTDKRGTVIFDGLCIRLREVLDYSNQDLIYQHHCSHNSTVN